MKQLSRRARVSLAIAAALLVALFVSACAPAIQDRMVVQINYKGTLADGTVFDSSDGKQPLEFVYGVGMMFPGLEAGMKGLKAGDKKTITIKAADAYGARDEAAIQEVPRSQFPKEMELTVGMPLGGQTDSGPVYATVKEIRDDVVVMDFNHPLAGQDLTFHVEVVKIRRATQEELAKVQTPAPSATPAAAPAQ